jgi:hypothetical protein
VVRVSSKVRRGSLPTERDHLSIDMGGWRSALLPVGERLGPPTLGEWRPILAKVRGAVDHGDGPHFICIGPGNSATTWVADHLKLQRDIWMPPIQEASYLKTLLRPGSHGLDLTLRWDWWSITKRAVRNRSIFPWRDEQYYRTARELSEAASDTPDLDGYRRLFTPAHSKLTGDIAPIYASFSVDEIGSFRSVLEPARIFMIARDPVQRFWSAMSRYASYRAFGDIDYESIEAAQQLFRDPQRSLQHHPTRILERWEAALGAERIRVFYFDDIVARPRQAFGNILEYIGSSYRHRISFVPVAYNRKTRRPRVSPSPEALEWIRRAFQEELARCASRFGAHGEEWHRKHRDARDAVSIASGLSRAAG